MHLLAKIGAMGILVASSFTARAEDWPKWLGPRADGISQETGLAEKWPETGPKQLWSIDVGLGYSSPLVVEGKLYFVSLVDGKDKLQCLDPDTGKVLWDVTEKTGWTGDFPGARATPTIVDGKIYHYTGGGELVCRQLADGKLLWSLDIIKETKAEQARWGNSSAPLVVGDRIYVQGGRGPGVPVALVVDRNTGKLVWQSEAKGAPKEGKQGPHGGGYASMILIDVEGTKQLISFASNGVYGMNPDNGKTLWFEPWITSWDVNASTPVYKDGHLFVSSDYGRGCMMLKLSPTSATKLWEKKDIKAHFQPVLLDRGHLYGNSEGQLTCMVWPTGEVKWQGRKELGNGGSLVRIGDRLIALSERGTLMLIKATPEGQELISKLDKAVTGSQVWATPLIYKGKLYAKGQDKLVCFDISAK